MSSGWGIFPFLMIIVLFIVGYQLLNKNDPFFKVVGGTITVLSIFLVFDYLFIRIVFS